MKLLWCWRCKAEVPMLDQDEWGRFSSLSHKGPDGNRKQQMYALALREYERITDVQENDPDVLRDRVLSNHGPGEKYGKPLRTPNAKMCASCTQPGGRHIHCYCVCGKDNPSRIAGLLRIWLYTRAARLHSSRCAPCKARNHDPVQKRSH